MAAEILLRVENDDTAKTIADVRCSPTNHVLSFHPSLRRFTSFLQNPVHISLCPSLVVVGVTNGIVHSRQIPFFPLIFENLSWFRESFSHKISVASMGSVLLEGRWISFYYRLRIHVTAERIDTQRRWCGRTPLFCIGVFLSFFGRYSLGRGIYLKAGNMFHHPLK